MLFFKIAIFYIIISDNKSLLSISGKISKLPLSYIPEKLYKFGGDRFLTTVRIKMIFDGPFFGPPGMCTGKIDT